MDQLPPEVQQQVLPLRSHYATRLVNLDPPDHTRPRTLVAKAFTPRVIDDLRSCIEQTAHELIDAAAADGRMEFETDKRCQGVPG